MSAKRHGLVFAALLVVGFVVGGAVAIDGPFGQAPAAWFQAIGSVAAIVAAIWIDRGSARRQTEERNATARSVLVSCAELVTKFYIKAAAGREIIAESGEARSGPVVRDGYVQLAKSMNGFPLHIIPDPRAVSIYCDVLQLAESVISLLALVDERWSTAKEGSRPKVLEFALKNLNELEAELWKDVTRIRQIAGLPAVTRAGQATPRKA